MRAKNRKIAGLFGMGALLVFSVSGCQIKEMTDSEVKVIANYAADVLISYDASYYDRFAEEEYIKKDDTKEENVAESTTQPAVQTEQVQENVAENTVVPEVTQEAAESIEAVVPQEANVADNAVSPREVGELFGLKDVEIAYIGYEVLQEYPVATQDQQLAFQMKATENHKLMVFSFNILNVAGEARNCNILGQNVKFRMRINDTENLTVQKTLLLDDLAQMNVVLQPMETKKGVVICQVPTEYNPEISTISMVIRTGGEDHVIKLQ